MRDVVKNFKNFLTEEKKRDRPDFKFVALLINTRTKERGKKDILNDIRSLRGVTIVAVKEAEKSLDTRKNDYSELSIKVDRNPVLGHASIPTILSHLTTVISGLNGVVAFKVKGIPETI